MRVNKVSIVICTYNRAKLLEMLLKELGRQEGVSDCAVEVIVVDNNSSDDTKIVTAGYGNKLPWVIKYVFELNQGKSYALNRGIKEATGEVIVFLDDDVIPHKQWLASMISVLNEFQADCVGGRILPAWEVDPEPWMLRKELKDNLGGVFGYCDRGDISFLADNKDLNLCYGANVAILKSALDKVGLYDVDQGPRGDKYKTGEDTAMLSKIYEANLKVAYAANAIVYHKVPAVIMNKMHLRKWRFISGYSASLRDKTLSARCPGWLIRECVVNAMLAVKYSVRKMESDALLVEIKFWTQLGQVFGFLDFRK